MVTVKLSKALADWSEVEHRDDIGDDRWLIAYRIVRLQMHSTQAASWKALDEAFRSDMPDIVSRAGG